MTATNPIQRNTKVISVSLDPETVNMLDALVKKSKQTKSAAIASFIKEQAQKETWKQVRRWGDETARKFNLTSEEDIYKFLGDA